MSMNSRFFRNTRACLLAGVISVGAPVVALAENLADALVGAYEYSRLIEQNRALLRAADEDVAIAVSALRPVIDFVTTISRSLSETTSGGVTLTDREISTSSLELTASMLLYDNGRSRLNIQAAQELVLATRAALVDIEQIVLLRAVEAYMNVIDAIETVEIRENNVRVLTEEFRASQDRFEVGEVTRTDVALSEAALAEARSNLSAAQGNLVNRRQEYLTAIGREPGQLEPPPPLPARPASIDAAKSVAVRNHPSVQQAQFEVSAAELTILSAEAALGPTVRLFGSVGVTESRNDVLDSDDASVGVDYSQPIYRGGRLAADIRQAMAQRDQARANLLQVQDNVAQDVATALIRFRVAEAQLQATDRRIQAADVAFRGVREEAALGARTTLDVLDSEQSLLDAQAARISAQTELNIAAYEILSAQGVLTAANLNLGVQLYDPAAYFNQVKDAPAYLSEQGRQLDRVLRALGKE